MEISSIASLAGFIAVRFLAAMIYSTSWFGKNHNTPAFAASEAGPFDQWPTGMGFE